MHKFKVNVIGDNSLIYDDEGLVCAIYENKYSNLIAAAPELLEALEELHGECKREFAIYSISNLGEYVVNIIAKAKGELK